MPEWVGNISRLNRIAPLSLSGLSTKYCVIIPNRALTFLLSHIPYGPNTNLEMLGNSWKAPPKGAKFYDLFLDFYFRGIDRTRLRRIFCSMESKFYSEISRVRAVTRSNNYIVLYLKPNIMYLILPTIVLLQHLS